MAVNVITYLLLFGSTLLLLDTLSLLRRGLRKGVYFNFPFIAAAISLCLAYGMYLSDFLGDRFAYYAVYKYSTTTLPVMFKLAASWGSSGGSLVLWLTCQLVINVAYRFSRARSHKSLSIMLACNILTATLGFLSISTGAFNLLPSVLPAGEGLNPLLMSFWMLLHPPITFIAYALAVMAALVALLSNEKVLERALFGFAWVLMTAAVVAGGLWAYEDLGWGGYWNWDAVETASLLPWLSLTVYFHALDEKWRRFSAALTGFSVLFGAFITRSGILESLHAYSLSPIGFVFLMGGLLFFIPLFRSRHEEAVNHNPTRSLYNYSMMISQWSLMLIALVCLAGILMSIFAPLTGSFGSPSFDYYNRALFPIIIVFFAALIGCSIPRVLTWTMFGVIIVAASIMGMFLSFMDFPVQNHLVDFGLPLVLTVSAVEVLGLFADARSRRVRAAGRRMIHIAMPIIILGVFFSTSMAWKQTLTVPLESQATVDGITIWFAKYVIRSSRGIIYVEGDLVSESSSVVLTFVVESNQQTTRVIDTEVTLYRFYGLVIRPAILHVGADDTYIVVRLNQEVLQILERTLDGNGEKPLLNEIDVTVEYKPLINLIWFGSFLLIAGGTVQTILNLKRQDRPREITSSE